MKFVDKKQSGFFHTVKSRVDLHFYESSIHKQANLFMWAKVFFFLFGFVVLYLLILSNQFTVRVMAVFAALLGAFGAFIGFNICHDAIHGTLSTNSKINKPFCIVFNLIGANHYLWNITHNIVHHTYTNVEGHDEDLEIAPGLIRISQSLEVKKVQVYQHFYAFLLYCLTSISWVLRKDFIKFFKKKIGQRDNTRHPRHEYFNLFLFKAIYYYLFIILPLTVLSITWLQFLYGFLIMHLVQGLVLGLVFQLAHVVEGTSFPLPNTEGNIEDAWAEHQMRTTANFATRSKVISFFCGGLNFQIEHHLFPKVCHVHYPAISKIVRQTAKEFNLPYIENSSFFEALISHYRILRKLGKESYRKKQLAPQPTEVR